MSLTVSYFRRIMLAMLAVSVTIVSPLMADDEGATAMFTVGSKAPPLAIEHWMSDGDGKFEHTTELKTDKVYVIEFWATWCGPCIRSMPHLAETQEKWADKGVQIISISDEKLEKVEAFLAKPVPEKEMTYADLTSAYCLTTDPDQSVYEDYFTAAGQTGIPTAFIVGKQGIVEWIGHPMEMDKPLEQVVAGTWDRETFAKEIKAEQERQLAMRKIEQKIGEEMKQIEAKLTGGEAEAGLALLDKAIANEEYAPAKPMLEDIRNGVVIQFIGGEQGATAVKKMIAEHKDDAQMLDQLAWTLYEQHLDEPLDEPMLAAALEAAETGAKAKPEDSSILDTFAHLLHAAGKLDQALEVQEKAVANLSGDESDEETKEFLEELKAEKANKDQ